MGEWDNGAKGRWDGGKMGCWEDGTGDDVGM